MITQGSCDGVIEQRVDRLDRLAGLEKVILLIAFIVIAAMFTYTVLTTELFANGQDQAT